jgi:hypothetical protein
MMRSYVPIEYPKWIGCVVVRSAAEEQAHGAPLREAAATSRTAEPARSTSPAGIRMRRTRERRRAGKLSIRYDISTEQIQVLTSGGFIDPAKQDHGAEVVRGVGRAIDRLCGLIGPSFQFQDLLAVIDRPAVEAAEETLTEQQATLNARHTTHDVLDHAVANFEGFDAERPCRNR